MVVMTLVMTSGTLPHSIPLITKNTLPKPSMMKVGMAMPSVSRVRMVTMAWGR